MTNEEGYTGLRTLDGRKIYSLDYIKKIRKVEDKKKNSTISIAQEGPQEDGLHSSVDILVYGGNRGGGKANTYDTPVCTPTGWRRMGDLKVGDMVCTPFDGIQTVSAIFEQGTNTVYRFHFDDGTYVDCMDNHRFYARQVDDTRFAVHTAREIMENYDVGQKAPNSLQRGSKFYEIPLCGEVETKSEEWDVNNLPIHPYVLGLIFGSRDYKGVWESYGFYLDHEKTIGMHVHKLGYNCLEEHGTWVIKGISQTTWRKALHETKSKIDDRKSGLTTGVPERYKFASVKARWEFLRGLFTMHGGFRKKHPKFDSDSRKMLEDTADIARSLGCFAVVKEIPDAMIDEPHYRLMLICPDDKRIFFRGVLKKRAHTNFEVPDRPSNWGVLTKRIAWIERKEKKEKCRCITVTGRDHLYLTNSWTINHNTWTLLAEPMYDIRNSEFNGIIFRKNKDDFNNIIKESRKLYNRFGHYNKSADDMTWYFDTGSELSLSIYEMAYQKFDDKYRGQQFAYIGIDELPQMSFKMFKFLMTCNRNTSGIKSRIIGTCNPDPYSWLATFISWYLDDDGLVIPERDGKIRYFYSGSEHVEETIWGDTPEEVYEQCKGEIEKNWDPEYEKLGYDKTTFFVKSFSFVKADLKYNKKLLEKDASYLASLNNQPEAIRVRELGGCWKPMEMGDDMVTVSNMERCFRNDEMLGDKVRRASCDVAFTGGDNCVLWLWIGNHIADVFVCKLDSVSTCNAIDAKLMEWGVTQDHFVYDLNGLGQTLKGYFPHAVPFNNVEAVRPKFKNVYNNIKSQCFYMLAMDLQQGNISFDPTILSRRFSGNGYDGKQLRDILMSERRAIRRDESKADKGWCLISKDDQKKLIGHSPDFIDSLAMKKIFDIKSMSPQGRSWVANM